MTPTDRTEHVDPVDPAQVPAPELDAARRDALLLAVLADPAPGRRTRPWAVPLAAAASVGAIAGIGVAVLGGGDDRAHDEVPAATDTTTSPEPEPVPFAIGRLDDAAGRSVLARCAAELGLDPVDFEVTYAQRLRDDGRRHDAVVGLDDTTGIELFCDSEGNASRIAGPDSKTVVVPPTADRPLTSAGVGATSTTINDLEGPISRLRTTEGFRVADHVARVDMRVGTADTPGTWYSAVPDHGFAYLAAHLDHGVRPDTALFLEVRAYDADGRPVTGPAPLGRQQLDIGMLLQTGP